MRSPGDPEIEHYVPKFLLRHFTLGEKQQICAYDKWSGRVFKTHVKNVAAEKGFYDLEMDERVFSLEPVLAALEDNAAVIVNKICDSRSIATISDEERRVLSMFVAAQFVRTKEHRMRFEGFTHLLKKKLSDLGFNDDQREKTLPREPEAFKWLGMNSVIQSPKLLPHLLSKTWMLFEAPKTHPLFISDNPITLHNEERGPYGNIGLAVKGIQIYLPISSSYSLALLCASIGDALKQTYYDFLASTCAGISLPRKFDASVAELRPLWEGVLFGRAVALEADNVKMLNSLQVMYSSRFVYCCREDFSLVEQMIQDKPEFRHGIGFTAV